MTKVHTTFGDKAGIQSKYPQITTVLFYVTSGLISATGLRYLTVKLFTHQMH